MPNPQFTKPWHGVPREEIHWNPSIIEETCIGCGTGVTGCNSLRVGIAKFTGTVADTIRSSGAPLAHRYAYLAGPPVMLGAVVAELRKAGISPENIHVDAFRVS